MNKALRIFILEDDQIIRFGIVSLLKEAGLEHVESAADATEALDVLTKFTPDLAILDISIDGENSGFDIAESLSKKDIPYFFVSGHKSPDVLREAAIKAPLAYLTKPIDFDTLVANILIFQTNLKSVLNDNDKQEEHPIVLKTVNGIVNINEEDITYIKTENVYINVFLINGKRLVLRKYLDNFLEELTIKSIIKVHRSYAVNLLAFSKYKGKSITVNGVDLPVSRTYKANLDARIKSICV